MKYLAFLLGLLVAAGAQAQQVPHPVGGPAASEMNELTSWNSLYGDAIKQGPAAITHVTSTLVITIDGAPLTARNTKDFTAQQILDAAFILPPGSGAKNYDGLRSVVYAPPGGTGTVNMISGLSTYVVSDTNESLFGGFPAAVGLFTATVARGDGTKAWGVNTLMSDTMTGVATPASGSRYLINEFDFNVSNPNTQIIGLQLAGGSKAQPAAAYGVVLQPLDVNVGVARSPKDPKDGGTVAKWSAFLQANPGSTDVFAGLSPKNATGSNIKSQDIMMGFYGPAGAYGNLVLSASQAQGLELYSAIASARSLTIYGGPGEQGGSLNIIPDKSGIILGNRLVAFVDGPLTAFASDAANLQVNLGNLATTSIDLYGTSVFVHGELRTTHPTVFVGTIAALAVNAGPNTGTLTNSPKAGNPTKWLIFDDNGTFRYIPTW